MISIGYNNMSESKVVIKDIPSVMEAYRQMDELIKSGRVMIEYGPNGELSAIRACIILNTKSGRHVYCAKPENYTRVTTEVRALYCDTVLIKTGRRVFERTTNDSTHAATLYVHGMRAGYPVFMKRDGVIVAADNCGSQWDKYSIHANDPQQPDPTPAPKAGVAPMPESETPDIDIDAALDEMNDAVGDFDDECLS